ncbi:MAG: YqhG family protein [Alicyclobacillus sp.]|nr:YqhG family protein [Alicyclobacillus sp.]
MRDVTSPGSKVSPLRTAQARQLFCDTYFQAVGATCVFRAEDYAEYQLPPDVDKEMVERPFYWMWIEKTGQQPTPTVLRLAFTQAAETVQNERIRRVLLEQAGPSLNEMQRRYFVAPKAELVSLGSYRLDRIYASCDRRGRFAAVMPSRRPPGATLVPWLLVNLRVSQRCDVTEQKLASYGVCLVNGQLVLDFYNRIANIPMEPMDPRRVARSLRVPVDTAVKHVKEHLTRAFERQPATWAEAAWQRLQQDVEQIATYYSSIAGDHAEAELDQLWAERDRKIADRLAQFTPRLEVEVLHLALVGLPDVSGS